jgi:hypothetical protein
MFLADTPFHKNTKKLFSLLIRESEGLTKPAALYIEISNYIKTPDNDIDPFYIKWDLSTNESILFETNNILRTEMCSFRIHKDITEHGIYLVVAPASVLITKEMLAD